MHKRNIIKFAGAFVLLLLISVGGYLIITSNDNSDENLSEKSVIYCSSEEFVTKLNESEVLYSNDTTLLNEFNGEISSIKDYQSSADCMYIVFLNSLFTESGENIDTNYQTLVNAYETKPYSDNLQPLYRSPSELQEITNSIKETREHNSNIDATIDNLSGDGSVVDQ